MNKPSLKIGILSRKIRARFAQSARSVIKLKKIAHFVVALRQTITVTAKRDAFETLEQDLS